MLFVYDNVLYSSLPASCQACARPRTSRIIAYHHRRMPGGDAFKWDVSKIATMIHTTQRLSGAPGLGEQLPVIAWGHL
ncbi:MAG TPA: hypothetical protein VFV68_12795 [Agriterribacter sp.]|nr:hypothetical protein [Agriterribacter sp.]